MEEKPGGMNKKTMLAIVIVVIIVIILASLLIVTTSRSEYYTKDASEYLLSTEDIENWEMIEESPSIHTVPPSTLSHWQREYRHNNTEELRIRILVFDTNENAHVHYEGAIQDLETVYFTPMENYSIGSEGSTGMWYNPYAEGWTKYYYVLYRIDNVHVWVRGTVSDDVQSGSYRAIAHIQLDNIVDLG